MSEFIRNEAEIALDDVTRGAGELLEVYAGLGARLNAGALAELLSRQHAELSQALERLMQARQHEGELPAGGDVEWAQWKTLGMRFMALLGDQPETEILAHEAAAQCDVLAGNVENALGHGPSPAVEQSLQHMAELVSRHAGALRDLASPG